MILGCDDLCSYKRSPPTIYSANLTHGHAHSERTAGHTISQNYCDTLSVPLHHLLPEWLRLVFSTTSPCWRLRENRFHWTWTNVVNMLSILLCLSDCSLAYISYENIWKELTKGLALPLFAFSAIVSGPFIIYQTNTNDELLSASENTRA